MTAIRKLLPRLFILLVLVQSRSAPAADFAKKVHGRVVLDANANGQIDADEKGLPGIRISDGVQWVVTGADGGYELTVADDPLFPYRPAQTITMSWPSNHWPTALWWRRVADIPADGRLDFGLRTDVQSLPFTFTQVTDPHNGFGGVFCPLWRDEIGRMKNRVKLSFATGDLGYASEKDVDHTFPQIRRFTDTFPVPMFHAIGNHDVVALHTADWNKQTDVHAYGGFTKHIGPVRWSFDYAGIHFVGLDWSHREGAVLETSGLEVTAAKWFEADLASVKSPKRIYLFMHSGYDKTGQLWPLLKQNHVELFLAGHSHRNVDDVVEGVPYLMTANFIGPYKLVNVTDNGFQVIHRCLGCKVPGRKHRGGSASYPLTGGCRVAVPNLDPRRAAHAEIKDRTLDSAEAELGDVKTQRLEIGLRVEPSTAKSWGLKIGPDDKGKFVELSATGADVRCGDVVTDSAREVGQKYDLFHLALDEKGLSVWCNEHARFDVPYVPSSPVSVSIFTKDGAARFNQVDVWQLKSGPPIQQYQEAGK